MDKDARIEILKNRLRNEADARQELEKIVHERTTKLINSHDFIQNMFSTMPGGMALLDRDGIIKSSSFFLSNLLTGENDCIKGEMILNFIKKIPNKDLPFQNGVLRFTKKKEYYFYLLTLKDELIPVMCLCSTLKDEEGEDASLFVVTDLSELKKSEEEKQALQNKLIEVSYKEGIAENAISLLHNVGNKLTSILTCLSQAKEFDQIPMMEKGINKLIQDINAIKGKEEIVDFFLTQENASRMSQVFEIFLQDSSEQKKHLYKIEELCNELSTVIGKQRSFASFKENTKGKVHLNEVLESCLKIHEERLTKENITTSVQIDNAYIYCEKLGLSQVISNIILNSIESIILKNKVKICEDNTLEFSLTESDLDVTLSIKDSGVGILEDHKKRLFQSGFTTKKMKAGLSLHNASNYIHNNNGEIKIKSNGINCGAEVLIKFQKKEKGK